MFTKTLATATASALLAGGAVAYTGVAAETHAKHGGPPPTMGERAAKRQDRAKARQAELAQRLGVSAQALTDAQDQNLRRALDARVAAGRLTVAERSAILSCRTAPLTCDRTNLPVRAHKKAKAKHKQSAAKRMGKRATRLAGALHLDKAKVLDALKAQRQAHHK
jgi:hypothetical protein